MVSFSFPPEPRHFTTTVTRCSPTVAFVEFSSSPQRKDEVPEEQDQKKPEDDMSGKVELVLSQKVRARWIAGFNPQVNMASEAASSPED